MLDAEARLVVAACAASCLLCLLAGRERDRGLWLGVAVVVALFALHKGLGGQAIVIAHAKQVAQGGGWYGERRGPQWVVTMVVALIAAGVVLRRTAGRPGPARTAVALAVSLVAYALVGMISLHAWDRLVSRHVGGVAIYTMIEVALSVSVGLCALAALAANRRKHAG